MQLVEFILLGASMPELLVKLKLKLLRKSFLGITGNFEKPVNDNVIS